MVIELAKNPQSILYDLTPRKVNLWHAWTGIATEAGEIGDPIKAHVIYNRPLNLENIIEEMGDMEFYLEQLRQEIGVTRNDVVLHNMSKLGIRYAQGYSDEQANKRTDKKEIE